MHTLAQADSIPDLKTQKNRRAKLKIIRNELLEDSNPYKLSKDTINNVKMYLIHSNILLKIQTH